VLLVGPETIATQCVSRQLATWGAKVTSTPALTESVSAFDLVLLADGVTAELVESNEGAPTPGIIRLKRLGETRTEATGMGGVAVPMPVKPRTLHAAVRKVLDLARRTPTTPSKPPAFGVNFAQRHPMRVLLVEDNPVNAQVAQLLLKRLGYTADWAVNGLKALDCIGCRSYDLVLMDLQMPEMDGLEATRALLSRVPLSQLPYIVALTANARKDDREACAEAGMHDFMSKPVKLETLAAGFERAHTWVVARSSRVESVRTPAK